MTSLAALAVSGCLAVRAGADRIVAGDLAGVLPGLAEAAPEAPLGLAPEPGMRRVFRVPEMRRLAAGLGVPLEPARDICVERPVKPPDPEAFLAAMRETMEGARITILDYSRQPVPVGALQFPANGLQRGSAGALWMGYVAYAPNRRFVVWARVGIAVTLHRVVAAADLPQGRAIAADQLREETSEGFPAAGAWLVSPQEAMGRWPRLPVRAGTAIRADMLETPRDVMRGQTVRVEVRSGAARLELEATAEASGSAGDTVPVVNPVSHKRFAAHIEGKGRVSVIASSGKVGP